MINGKRASLVNWCALVAILLVASGIGYKIAVGYFAQRGVPDWFDSIYPFVKPLTRVMPEESLDARRTIPPRYRSYRVHAR
jgi:hypothetical protein